VRSSQAIHDVVRRSAATTPGLDRKRGVFPLVALSLVAGPVLALGTRTAWRDSVVGVPLIWGVAVAAWRTFRDPGSPGSTLIAGVAAAVLAFAGILVTFIILFAGCDCEL
jgi:hypothetical protein